MSIDWGTVASTKSVKNIPITYEGVIVGTAVLTTESNHITIQISSDEVVENLHSYFKLGYAKTLDFKLGLEPAYPKENN